MNDADYKPPFALTAKLNKLSVKLDRPQLSPADIQRLQAIPRALALAAVRTRSASVADIFTSNAGVGPTLSQDSKALFHADHNNLATTGFGTDDTAWNAVREEAYDLRADPGEGLDLARGRGVLEGLTFDPDFCRELDRVRQELRAEGATAPLPASCAK